MSKFEMVFLTLLNSGIGRFFLALLVFVGACAFFEFMIEQLEKGETKWIKKLDKPFISWYNKSIERQGEIKK